jgi:hypothetical protein
MRDEVIHSSEASHLVEEDKYLHDISNLR